ncbi:MAG: AraC family transcriptional regulator [Candidatus Gastranaerophilales bacterium]|nr:AraC family transcriptional regulator [Candidatus Gastranaerophilales bacterium]
MAASRQKNIPFPAQEIFDDYLWQKDKQVITRDVHHLSGLGNFTHWRLNTSEPPTSMHFHSDMMEIHCMVKGKRVCILENKGQPKSYNIMGNEVFLTFPYELHSTGSLPQTPCEFYALQLITRERDNLLGLNQEYSNALCDRLLALKYRRLTLSVSALQQIRTAFHLFSSADPHDIHTGVQYLSCFLHNLIYLQPIGDEIVRPIDTSMQRTLDYVEKNFNRALSLAELAKISGYSLSRFKAKFKEEVGITPAEFITLQKIEKAKTLLETSNSSITDLAFDLGFSSSNYFCSAFKKQTGISPYQYRKKQQAQIY